MEIDSQKLDEVAALMEHHGLTRVRLSEVDGRVVELERMRPPAPMPPAAAPTASPVMSPAPAMPPIPSTVPAPAPAAAPAPAPVSSFGGTPADAAPTTVPADPAAAHPAQADTASSEAVAPADENLVEVNAPMMGVFYAAPSPEADPFVRVGDAVHAGDTLCIVETMKLMNEVVAETDGVVAEILADDGDLIEYGACLMKIDAAGTTTESEA